MFERKEPFQWKIPILILTGILVLSGGIYIGVKTRKVEEKPAFNNETINEENEETKDSFGLSENCEIWLYKRSEEGSLIDSEPNMIGFAPKELLDKTKEEIRTYLSEQYPDKEIDSITQHQIVLSEKAPLKDTSRSNKYSAPRDIAFSIPMFCACERPIFSGKLIRTKLNFSAKSFISSKFREPLSIITALSIWPCKERNCFSKQSISGLNVTVTELITTNHLLIFFVFFNSIFYCIQITISIFFIRLKIRTLSPFIPCIYKYKLLIFIFFSFSVDNNIFKPLFI